MTELLHSTICKHIHLVARKDKQSETPQESVSTNTNEGSLTNSLQIQCRRQPDLNSLNQKLIKKLSVIAGKVSTCNDDHILVSIERFLTSAMGTFDALDTHIQCQFNKGMPTTTSPANNNIENTERQPSFYTTRGKGKLQYA